MQLGRCYARLDQYEELRSNYEKSSDENIGVVNAAAGRHYVRLDQHEALRSSYEGSSDFFIRGHRLQRAVGLVWRSGCKEFSDLIRQVVCAAVGQKISLEMCLRGWS